MGVNLVFGTFNVGDRTYVLNGYFEIGQEKSLINGLLVDSFGPSNISDFNMTSNNLDFKKIYSDRRDDVFEYSFVRKGRILWVGEYRNIDDERGKSVIVLNPINISKETLDELFFSVDR